MAVTTWNIVPNYDEWGSDFSSSKYFEKINQQPQQSTVPPNPPENLRTYPKAKHL